MPYKKLNEQVRELSSPQRGDAFVKAEVREGDITAAYLPERFTLPKSYVRRGSSDTYSRESRDMMFDATPKFENINKELASSRRGGKIKMTAQNIESGLVDFKELAAQTRAHLRSSYTKGQALGNSRGKKSEKK